MLLFDVFVLRSKDKMLISQSSFLCILHNVTKFSWGAQSEVQFKREKILFFLGVRSVIVLGRFYNRFYSEAIRKRLFVVFFVDR